MSERLIAADEARCRGDGSTHCADCARRMQLERDDEKRWYPHMEAAPIRGSCVYKILVRSNTPNVANEAAPTARAEASRNA